MNIAADIIAVLNVNAQTGLCHCPPHDDGSAILAVREGTESWLSAMQLARLLGIAVLTATKLMAVRPPWTKGYVIAAEHDELGRKAAER